MDKRKVISELKQSVMLACSHDDYEVRYNAMQRTMKLVSMIEENMTDEDYDEENRNPIGFC